MLRVSQSRLEVLGNYPHLKSTHCATLVRVPTPSATALWKLITPVEGSQTLERVAEKAITILMRTKNLAAPTRMH